MTKTRLRVDRRFVLGAAALGGAAVLGGVAWNASRNAPDEASGTLAPLKVGNQKGTVRSLLTVAGVLRDVPYAIEWSEFPAAQHLLEALTAGAADIGFVGDAPFLIAYASGSPLKVVSVAALTRKQATAGTAVVVRENAPFRTLSDLKGRRIATGKISIGHYVLLRALEREGLTSRDVEIVFLPPADAKAAFVSGQIDGWATWSPFLSAAILHDKARVLVDSAELGLDSQGYHVATPEAIRSKATQLRDFSERLDRAYAWVEGNEAEYAAALSKDTGLPLDVALATISATRSRLVPTDAVAIAHAEDILTHLAAASGEAGPSRPAAEAFVAGLDKPRS